MNRKTQIYFILALILFVGCADDRKFQVCKAIVLSKEIITDINEWSGIHGFCSINLKIISDQEIITEYSISNGHNLIKKIINKFKQEKQITISPGDWEDCMRVSKGDEIEIYREQYRHDMRGQWKPWRVK